MVQADSLAGGTPKISEVNRGMAQPAGWSRLAPARRASVRGTYRHPSGPGPRLDPIEGLEDRDRPTDARRGGHRRLGEQLPGAPRNDRSTAIAAGRGARAAPGMEAAGTPRPSRHPAQLRRAGPQ